MESEKYFAADADLADERVRLGLIEGDTDPITTRYLSAVGITSGWRCLEVGAGGGSITRWMSEKVGDAGKVVAADLDTRHVDSLKSANVEVRRMDITQDDVEVGNYDLAHCRFLLMHLRDPAAVVAKMAKALRPGGWLVAEEVDNDFVKALDEKHPLGQALTDGHRRRFQFMKDAGIMDGWIGRELPALMERAGLVDVESEGVNRLYRGGDPISIMWVKSWERMNDRFLAEGVATKSEIKTMREALEDPTLQYRGHLTQVTWGRHP